MHRSVPALLLLVVVGLAASCGLRSGVETGAGASSSKPTTASVATWPPTTLGGATTLKPLAPPTTKPGGAGATTAKPTFPPTTKAGGSVTTKPTTKPVTPTTVAGDKKTLLCAAAKIYAVDDLPGLGARIIDDPDGLLASYEAMLANTTPELAAGIKALGPFTRAVLGAVKSGQIKTAAELQTWLVNAPADDLTGWVTAQQTVAPGLHAVCGTTAPTGAPAPAS